MKYSKIKFNENFKYRRIDDIIMAYDESSGNLFELNSTGAEIFEMIANGMQIEEIENNLEKNYQVETEVLHNDLDDLLESFEKMNIINCKG